MASKTIDLPAVARSAAWINPVPVAKRPRESLERAVKQASVRTAERKRRLADLHDAIRSASPSLATERAKRIKMRAHNAA